MFVETLIESDLRKQYRGEVWLSLGKAPDYLKDTELKMLH